MGDLWNRRLQITPINPIANAFVTQLSRRPRIAESALFRFRSGMGSKRLDKIGDYVRHGFDLQVFCKCGHKTKIDAAALADRLHRQGKSPIMMFVEAKLRCSKCGRKDVTCGPGWKDT